MRVAVVGAGGQLGAAVAQACVSAHEVTRLTRREVDITDDRAVATVLRDARPDAIVNCAAFNDVDGAEDRPAEALRVNAFAVRAIARAAEAAGATLVHYSTDFVFDGRGATPYTERDHPNPRSVYGASKLLGEWFALDNCGADRSGPPCYVLRVESLFGSAPGGQVHGSVHGIHAALRDGRPVKVFSDRTISPTYVVDAAAATVALLERRPARGVYHCVNSGSCTWLELANELARLTGAEPRFEPVRMQDMTLKAQRPMFCALANAKLASAAYPMPGWQDALARAAKDGL